MIPYPDLAGLMGLTDRRTEAEANTLAGVLRRWEAIPSLCGTPMPLDLPELSAARWLCDAGRAILVTDAHGAPCLQSIPTEENHHAA